MYSEAFDSLPADVKVYLSRRLNQVLPGEDTSADFAHFSSADRQAIREILEATKPALLTMSVVQPLTRERKAEHR